MRQLFPDIKPYARHHIDVDDVHQLYVDESGNENGIPVLFLHGGPGSGCDFDSRRYFDPAVFRIILLDQRGAGRSVPNGILINNTLDHLVEDIERVRGKLGITQWALFGGGWGTTLALAYAERYTSSVLGLVLRGIFLGRDEDIAWIYEAGANQFFPDDWLDFMQPIGDSGHDNPCQAYFDRMQQGSEIEQLAAAKAWSLWEARCANLHPNWRLINHYSAPHRALSRCRLGSHYMVNRCFLSPNQLLNDSALLGSLPGIIVQGRFDVLTPPAAAFALHKAWPKSELRLVREAGHSATEPLIIDALVRATDDLALQINAAEGRKD